MAKKITIRPTSSVYATYKRLSYQPWTAIAEFVDNSTQSFYDHKDELMAQKYAKGLRITIDYIDDQENGDRLEIYDDAYGMEWYDFQRAVVLDRPPQNTTGRNEFGMGLKQLLVGLAQFGLLNQHGWAPKTNTIRKSILMNLENTKQKKSMSVKKLLVLKIITLKL